MEGELAASPSPRHQPASPLPTIGRGLTIFRLARPFFPPLSATCLRASRRRSRLTLDPLGPCFALLSYSPSPRRAAPVLFHESGGRHKAAERVPFTCVLPPCLLVRSALSNSPHNCRGGDNGESVELAVPLESPDRASKPPSLFSQNTEIVNLPLACSLVLNVLLGQSGSWY